MIFEKMGRRGFRSRCGADESRDQNASALIASVPDLLPRAA